AKRGESPPAPPTDQVAPPAPAVANLGTQAPDFMAPDFGSRESARLQRWLGRPVVLVFYNPAAGATADTPQELPRFARKLAAAHRQDAHVLGLAMTDDADRVRRQRDALQLTFPLLNGTGLYKSYDIQATPKVMVLDATGVVRGSFVGWGAETPAAVVEELKRWLPRQEAPKK